MTTLNVARDTLADMAEILISDAPLRERLLNTWQQRPDSAIVVMTRKKRRKLMHDVFDRGVEAGRRGCTPASDVPTARRLHVV